MSDKKRDNKDNRSPEEIEREIEGTREKLAEDLDDLGQKVSPENLKQQAKGTLDDAKDVAVGKVEQVADDVKQRTETAGDRLVDGIREEPLPVAALLGVLAAGYLLMEARKKSGSGDGSSSRDRMEQDVGSEYDTSPLVDRTGQRMGTGAQDSGGGDTGSSMMETVKSNGLLIGIGALAAGAAVGLLLPASSKPLDKAREKLSETREKAQDKLSETREKAQGKLGEMKERSQKSSSDRSNGIQVRERIRVNKSAEELYSFWRDLENLPRVMSHLKTVSQEGGKRSHWVAKGPLNTSVEWDAVITDERPNESIAWRSESDSQVETEGAVSFRNVGASSTDIIVSLTYHPPGGPLGEKIAKMFGEEPSQQISDDLERFKHEVESGRMKLGSTTAIGGTTKGSTTSIDTTTGGTKTGPTKI